MSLKCVRPTLLEIDERTPVCESILRIGGELTNEGTHQRASAVAKNVPAARMDWVSDAAFNAGAVMWLDDSMTNTSRRGRAHPGTTTPEVRRESPD